MSAQAPAGFSDQLITETELIGLLSKDGNPLPPEEVSNIIAQHINTKYFDLVSKIEIPKKVDLAELRQRYRAETLREVNDYALALGAEGDNYKDQLLSLSTKQSVKEITNADIMNSELFKDTVRTKDEALELEKKSHQDTIKSQQDAESLKTITSNTDTFLSDEDSLYVIPEDENIRETAKRNYLRDLTQGELKIVYRDGKEMVVDANGDQAVGENFAALTPKQHRANVASRYFVKQVTKPKDAPVLGEGSGIATGGFPVMKSMEDLQNTVDKWLLEGKGKDDIAALRKHYDENVKPTL